MTTEPTATSSTDDAPPGTLISGFVHAQINVSDLDRFKDPDGTILEYVEIKVTDEPS